MCISNQNLYQVVEIIAVVLLTISVVTIGASLSIFGSITGKMTSTGISCVNILLNISLIFGLRDKSKFFIVLWMASAMCNVVGGSIMLGLISISEVDFNQNLDDFIPLSIVIGIYLTCYIGLYIWSAFQVLKFIQGSMDEVIDDEVKTEDLG